ncbi:MAG: hypothetical protein H5T74_12245 [Actinobacteria bacterium]|nr:hypothetical protein [Actinomycetota bacterium]
MAGSKLKVRSRKPGKAHEGKKAGKHLTDQLEEKYIGTSTEVFSRISAKESEIRSKVSAERARAERLLEDAKGEAAALKRKATLEDIGRDAYDRIIAEARAEIENIERSTAEEIARVEKTGSANLEKAVALIVNAVLKAGEPD